MILCILLDDRKFAFSLKIASCISITDELNDSLLTIAFNGLDFEIPSFLLDNGFKLTPSNLPVICANASQYIDGYEYLEILFAHGLSVLKFPSQGFASAFANNAHHNLSRIGEEVFNQLEHQITDEKRKIATAEANINSFEQDLRKLHEVKALIQMDDSQKAKKLQILREQITKVDYSIQQYDEKSSFLLQQLYANILEESRSIAKIKLYQIQLLALQKDKEKVSDNINLILISNFHKADEIEERIVQKSDEIGAEKYEINESIEKIAAIVLNFYQMLDSETKVDMIASCLIYSISTLSAEYEILLESMPSVIAQSGLKQQILDRLSSITVNDSEKGVEGHRTLPDYVMVRLRQGRLTQQIADICKALMQ